MTMDNWIQDRHFLFVPQWAFRSLTELQWCVLLLAGDWVKCFISIDNLVSWTFIALGDGTTIKKSSKL